MKSTLHITWSPNGWGENTAEHSWRLTLLTGTALTECLGSDRRKVLMMCLIHDTGEIYDGDISATSLLDVGEKYQMELDAVRQVFGPLPEGQRGAMMALWQEYNDNSSPETHLVEILNKAEIIIQYNQEKNPLGFNYGFNLEYGVAYLRDDLSLQQVRRQLDKKTGRRRQKEKSHVQPTQRLQDMQEIETETKKIDITIDDITQVNRYDTRQWRRHVWKKWRYQAEQ